MPKADTQQLRRDVNALAGSYTSLVQNRINKVVQELESLLNRVKEASRDPNPVIAAEAIIRHVLWALPNLGLAELASEAAILRSCQGQKWLLDQLS